MSGSSSEILQTIMQDTDAVVSNLEATKQRDYDQELAKIGDELDQAAEIGSKNDRDLRTKVLEAKLDELQTDMAKEERDLAKAVFGVNAMMEKLGEAFSRIGEYNASEQKIVDEADRRLRDAQEAFDSAQSSFFIGRGGRVKKAREELDSAEAGIKLAEAEARRRARSRLLNADIEASLQEIQLRVAKTISILESRRQTLNAQLRNTNARKKAAFEMKARAAQAMESLEQNLEDAEARLRQTEEEMSSLVNGTREHAAKSNEVSDLRTEVETIRGKRNSALTLFQSKEKFAAALEIDEVALIKLRDNTQMWIIGLQSDTEERVVTFRDRLEAQKALAEHDIAKTLDDVGAEADQRNVEFMIRSTAVSDRLRTERMKAHPGRMQEIAQAAATFAEHIAKYREEEAEIIQWFKDRYGIDPTKSSFFNYPGQTEGAKEKESAAPIG